MYKVNTLVEFYTAQFIGSVRGAYQFEDADNVYLDVQGAVIAVAREGIIGSINHDLYEVSHV